MKLVKEIGKKVIEEETAQDLAEILESDGSYLFNLLLKDFFSYQDLEKFTIKLAEQRGISVKFLIRPDSCVFHWAILLRDQIKVMKHLVRNLRTLCVSC